MNHAAFRELVSAFKDGELSSDDERSVQTHLQSCRECREYLLLLEETGAMIKEAGTVELDARFTAGVMRSVRDEVDQTLLWMPVERFARRFVLGLSLAVVLFVTLSMMFQPKDPVVIESYLSGEHSDSSVTRTLLTKDAISKDDVLFAAVTRK